jgi:hypothetical protein
MPEAKYLFKNIKCLAKYQTNFFVSGGLQQNYQFQCAFEENLKAPHVLIKHIFRTIPEQNKVLK